MSSINWAEVLALLQVVLHAAKPELKAVALTELKALEGAQTNETLKGLIQEVEVLVAAA